MAPAGTCAQTPKWFVSHWWGEPVKDFVKALKKHAEVRGLEWSDVHFDVRASDGKRTVQIAIDHSKTSIRKLPLQLL